MLRKTAISLFLTVAFTMPALAEPGALGEPKMLIHGNYCGPGNNAPLAPVDALDAACARHDACTPTGSVPSRACNARLEQEATAISRDPRQPEDLRTMAGFVAAGASMLQITDDAHLTPTVRQAGVRQ
ncbi:hypothetical protein FV232_27295 [Methylobacterium sp. WL30]|uniref:hypothetical protein n=1 Tax=unclassified Methylobacterium TaxID=2615210 RepID=UPI0011CB71F6|nr:MULTISPECIES: hypothetical protein [unclassified Methylobacterium]RZL29181.1 MAG: hypothetical protein EOP64_02035 [Sphingomonas sp.]TXM89372.1 hypothetical protein FV223_21825 [Methylobacterium sp. WL116]TXN26803.1 hypothetical protein FV225_22860 [Methylobacterium sp. WL93]TXN43921.1 hypothetical protein FV227_27350 [Methylobacterium sp. WL119]TXN61312.1 hypothetical protein FV232_27295 [Methylobacterium sp. WL30]